MESEAVAIHRALGDIPHAFVKGVVLAEALYDQIGDRPMSDIDLVVSFDRLGDAEEALTEVGYHRLAPYRSLDNPTNTREAPLVHRSLAGTEIDLDLHWHLLDPLLFPLDEEEVWRRLDVAPVLDRIVPTTNATLTALHLAIHHVQHRCALGHTASDLRRHVLKNSDRIDWPDFWHVAEAVGAEHIAAFALLHSDANQFPQMVGWRARVLFGLIGSRMRHSRRRWDVPGVLLQWALLPPRGVLVQLRRLFVPPRFIVGTVLDVPTDRVRPRHYLIRIIRRDRSIPDPGATRSCQSPSHDRCHATVARIPSSTDVGSSDGNRERNDV